ncbi:MAG: glycosyltransferase family 4 protein [Ancalomicrobiaceae bacterium]|nr:glycosyltransferase family 4 protein [Ancalomicrobiaceae bacterium]
MRIAQIAPLYETVPPTFYGGTERIISYLTEALVEFGHDVTIFAAAGSQTNAKLVPCRDKALWLDDRPLKSATAAHLSMLDAVRRRSNEFDVLHFHLSHFIHFPLFEHMAGRTVTTPHGRLDYVDLPAAYACWPGFPMVSISDRQRQPLPDARWMATVQHGLPLDLYTPPTVGTEAEVAGHLAFLGRFSRDKRPDRAIEIARRTGLKLKMAAKLHKEDEAYFRQAVEPALGDGQIEHVGEIGDADKPAFLGNAAALLFPIDWPEPFGLVVIEAMACGTPVIAWDNGAMREIIDDGVTGFVVNSIEEAVDAVARARQLDRRRIRAVFEQRFSAAVMARNYVAVYEDLIRTSSRPAMAVVG